MTKIRHLADAKIKLVGDDDLASLSVFFTSLVCGHNRILGALRSSLWNASPLITRCRIGHNSKLAVLAGVEDVKLGAMFVHQVKEVVCDSAPRARRRQGAEFRWGYPGLGPLARYRFSRSPTRCP